MVTQGSRQERKPKCPDGGYLEVQFVRQVQHGLVALGGRRAGDAWVLNAWEHKSQVTTPGQAEAKTFRKKDARSPNEVRSQLGVDLTGSFIIPLCFYRHVMIVAGLV